MSELARVAIDMLVESDGTLEIIGRVQSRVGPAVDHPIDVVYGRLWLIRFSLPVFRLPLNAGTSIPLLRLPPTVHRGSVPAASWASPESPSGHRCSQCFPVPDAVHPT